MFLKLLADTHESLFVLDAQTEQALNELDINRINDEKNYAYQHDLVLYGIDAMIHVFIMKALKTFIEKKSSIHTLIAKYGIDNTPSGFEIYLNKIEDAGIFIPIHKQQQTDPKLKRIIFFDPDYLNFVWTERLIGTRDSFDKLHAWAKGLVTRKWTIADLENITLVEEGIKFGRTMWEYKIKEYEKYKVKYGLDKDIAVLAEKLIQYYSSIIDS
jgi:hypothetical protein